MRYIGRICLILAVLILSLRVRALACLNLGTLHLLKGITPSASSIFPAYLLGERGLLSLEHLQLACLAIDEAYSLDPQSFQSNYWRGFTELASGHMISDLRRFKTLTESDYRSFSAAFLYGFSLYRSGDIQSALDHWRSASDGNCEILLERTGSIDACRMAILISPTNSEPYFCLGLALRNSRNLADALSAFQSALLRNTSIPAKPLLKPFSEGYSPASVNYHIGEIYLLTGQLQKAESYFDEAMRLDPMHYWAPLQKADIENRLHRRPEVAKAILLSLLNQYPSHVAAILSLGCLCENDENLPCAVQHYERALSIAPNHSLSLAFLSRAQLKQSQFSQALANARKALSLDPLQPEACRVAAQSLFAQERFVDALPYAKSILATSPPDPEIVRMIIKIYRALGNETEMKHWMGQLKQMSAQSGAPAR